MAGLIDESPFQPEAAPDVEVILKIAGASNNDCNILEACININKTTLELKQSLSTPLEIPIINMEVWKGTTQLQDSVKLMNYDIKPDDCLEIRDTRL